MPLTLSACPFESGALIWIYLRYSADGQSVESQEAAVREWCQLHQLAIGALFKDEAKSGTSVAGRSEFLRMFNQLTDGDATPRPAGVVLWSFARFAREVQDAEYYKWSLRHFGFVVTSLADNIPQGELAPVFEAFQHVQDAAFVRRLRMETKRGLHNRAAQGYPAGGFPPIGYRAGEKISQGRRKNGEERFLYKWEFDPATYDRVKLAWTLRLAGKSYHEIHAATRLLANAQGYYDFFRRVIYAGAIKFGETITWDAHPAYITREEWEWVQSLTKKRAAKFTDTAQSYMRRRANNPYLLSGILRCGLCGWAMSGSKGGGSSLCYRCDWRHRQGHQRVECKQPSIVAYALHDPLIEWLSEHVFTFERMRDARDRLNTTLTGDRRELVERRAQLEADRQRVSLAVARLVDAIERGGYVGEIQDRYEARQVELKQVETDLAKIDAALTVGQVQVRDDALHVIARLMQEILSDLAEQGHPALRGLVQGVVQKAELFLDKIVLYYSPLPFVQALASQFNLEAMPLAAPGVFVLQSITSIIGSAPILASNRVPVRGTDCYPTAHL